MKCIGNIKKIITVSVLGAVMLTGCIIRPKPIVTAYETETYNHSIYQDKLYTEQICVSKEDVSIPSFNEDTSLHAAALFNLSDHTVAYANHIHDKLFPASTTKILTALVAMNTCDLDDIVTVSEAAAASSFAADEQVCGLMEGDKLSLRALLYGMLLHSGNDNATAIAEYVGGDLENFSDMMNEQAKKLLATNTNFITPNGLHDEEHYTTAYDLYLIFNECIKNEEFLDIISSSSYTADIEGADGVVRQETWEPTSYYARGVAALPTGATVIGGKTGYTEQAGNCLILLDQDEQDNFYISIVMGADSKDLLYSDMTAIIDEIPNLK